MVCSAQDFSLTGTWSATNGGAGEKIVLVFEADGHAQMGKEGQVKGAKNADGTRDVSITYKADYKKKPVELDITITGPGGEEFKLYGIVDVVNTNEVRIIMDTDGRPADFSAKDTATFYRK